MRHFSFPIDDCARSLMVECGWGFVEFWHLLAICRGAIVEVTNDDTATLDPEELHDAAIHLARMLLESKKVVVGDLGDDGFKKWDLSIDEAICKIETGWKELGRDPDAIDHVAVFWSLDNWQAFLRGEIPPPKIY
jgi:hypothetical protein